MFAVRYAALAALVVWLGGMLVLALVVAPSTFRALEAADPLSGRVQAGLAFGAILRQFHLVSYACGAILLVGLFVMKFIGPPPRAFIPRASIAALMLAMTLYSGLLVGPEIDDLQAHIEGSVTHLAESDPRRARFDELHQTSTTLMAVNMALGLVLLFWYTRE
jgi:uncharacterized membrane protein